MNQRARHSLIMAVLPGCALSLDYQVVDTRPTPGGACGSDCVAPPRQLAPLSTARVSTRRPTLRWVPSPGLDQSLVELCRDRGCTEIESAHELAGARLTLPRDLAPGVHFWRMSARSGTGRVSRSPVWEFFVGRGAPAVDTSYGSSSDFDGDGIAEVIVGAPRANALLGEAYVYAGARAGQSTHASLTITSTDGPRSLLGQAVDSAGDLNGDGFADLVLGAYGVLGDQGRAYVYPGSARGVDLSRRTTLAGPGVPGGSFGFSLAGVGDLNGDGYADLAVGAFALNRSTGSVWVYLGGPEGVAERPAVQLQGPTGSNGHFGSRITGGDFNGDGYSDMVVGAFGAEDYTGRAYVYLGGPDGVQGERRTTLQGGEGAGGWFGGGLAVLGDVNGDGYPDLGVSEWHFMSRPGRVWVYLGGASGIDDTRRYAITSNTPEFSGFGSVVSGVGDLNGDGLDEVVVSEILRPGGGGIGIYFGGAEGIGRPSASQGRAPDLELGPPDGAGSLFGASAAGLGDVNGDGVPDLAVSAYLVEGAIGRVYLYYGTSGSVGRASTREGIGREPDVTLRGARPADHFGWTLSEARFSRRTRALGVYDAGDGGVCGGDGTNRHQGGVRSGGAVCTTNPAAARGART